MSSDNSTGSFDEVTPQANAPMPRGDKVQQIAGSRRRKKCRRISKNVTRTIVEDLSFDSVQT
eukprot:2481683-Ditylum_brightwellii.AAC.1